jgi:hypothetical protein
MGEIRDRVWTMAKHISTQAIHAEGIPYTVKRSIAQPLCLLGRKTNHVVDSRGICENHGQSIQAKSNSRGLRHILKARLNWLSPWIDGLRPMSYLNLSFLESGSLFIRIIEF